MTQIIGLDFNHLSTVLIKMKYLPVDFNIVKKILSNFSNLHVDSDNVIYSLPIARVFELRGFSIIRSLNKDEGISLLEICGEIADEESTLGILFTNYQDYLVAPKRKHNGAFINTFTKYIPYVLNNNQRLNHLVEDAVVIP